MGIVAEKQSLPRQRWAEQIRAVLEIPVAVVPTRGGALGNAGCGDNPIWQVARL